LGGQKITGADVREQNGMWDECQASVVGSNADLFAVLATQAISNVIKSSFGPSGLDKMMVDDIGV
jgi:T-complex protein 1 subunit alpha